MRAEDIRSNAFQTRTSASGEKISPARVVEDVPRRSQTSAIRLDGSKGKNGKVEAIAAELAEVCELWIQSADEQQLRRKLLAFLLNWNSSRNWALGGQRR